MSDRREIRGLAGREGLSRQVLPKIDRKLASQRAPNNGVWSGLGAMGLVGWSVTIPTLLGAGVGAWLDEHHPGHHSWTLSLLIGGLVLGCWTAWHWMTQQEAQVSGADGDEHE